MARPSNTDERREQIVTGLARAMARHGYEGATIPRIAEQASLSPGLVHYHFEDKKSVLLALAERLVAGARARVERRMAAAGEDPWKRLEAFIDGLLDLGPDADRAAAACWALIAAEAVRQPDVREVYRVRIEDAVAELHRLLADVLRLEGKSRRGAKAMAAGLMATVEGFFALGAGAPGVVPEGTAAGIARRMAVGLVNSSPREPT